MAKAPIEKEVSLDVEGELEVAVRDFAVKWKKEIADRDAAAEIEKTKAEADAKEHAEAAEAGLVKVVKDGEHMFIDPSCLMAHLKLRWLQA